MQMTVFLESLEGLCLYEALSGVLQAAGKPVVLTMKGRKIAMAMFQKLIFVLP